MKQQCSQITIVDITDSKSVIVKETGFESDRITCVLAIRPDGTILKPLLLLKGSEDGVLEEHNGVFVTRTEMVWITESSCILSI